MAAARECRRPRSFSTNNFLGRRPMPLTPLQKDVLRLLASNRNPESHVAGGAVINRLEGSLRYSADLDLFHDVAEKVMAAAETDAQTLTGHGFHLQWLVRQPTLQRARLIR